MLPENILAGCRTKGISIVGSGDALHPGWRRLWQETEVPNGICVIPQTEVEDVKRVHHVILMETFEQFEELQEKLTPACSHFATCGRPHVYLNGEKIAETVHECGGLIGPAHAFTPWTSLFAAYELPSDCYGEEKLDFCELGLSADSSYGAGIEEFADVPFLTNSDAHSHHPTKLGREFTRLDVRSQAPKDVLAAIAEGRIVLNAGFFPEEGKYNRTACVRCFEQFTLEEAERYHWKCPHDGGQIKLGVRERAQKMSTLAEPAPRPPYIKMIPLAEVIARVLHVANPGAKKVVALYEKFLAAFGNEIAVLLEVPKERLAEVSPAVAEAVIMMREGRVKLFPGGGGKYGSFSFE
jgi:Uncharacterized conserved protein